MTTTFLRRSGLLLVLVMVLLPIAHCSLSTSLHAHPVPSRTYDRTVRVHLTPDALVVHYRLEVEEATAIYVDLKPLIDQAEFKNLSGPRAFYDAYTNYYGPILASNITATLDGKPLTLTCVQRRHEVRDHLCCDFVFKAPWKLHPGERHQLALRDWNCEQETGLLALSLSNDPAIGMIARTEPDEPLRLRQVRDLKPGEDAQRRKASATFALAAGSTADQVGIPPLESKPAEPPSRRSSLLALLDDQRSVWVLLCLAAGIGAIHALTPGHGKTVVAAYLVGERGTVWHALVLGLVTTLTHTGVVLALAVALCLIWPHGSMSASAQQNLHVALEMGGGLLVAGLGIWLLLRRLAGRADHFHIGGHGHHHHSHDHGDHSQHHHGATDHAHDEHGQVHPIVAETSPVGWWGLVVLGVSGGIVPCWDAIAMLVLAVALNLLWLAVPLLLAFSAGLAAVLVAIGIVVVQAKGPLGVRWGNGRLLRSLPLVSALVITGMGLWMCYDSVHPEAAGSSPPVLSAPATR